MKNVNKAIAFISALALMGTVTACGSTDSGTSSTSAETSATTETTPAKELDEEDKAAVAEMDTGDDEKLENGTVSGCPSGILTLQTASPNPLSWSFLRQSTAER